MACGILGVSVFTVNFFRKAFSAKGRGAYDNHYGSYSERLNKAAPITQVAPLTTNDIAEMPRVLGEHGSTNQRLNANILL